MSENVLKGDKTSIESISYLEVYLSLTSSQSSVKILTRNRILLSPPRPAELEVSLKYLYNQESVTEPVSMRQTCDSLLKIDYAHSPLVDTT